MLLMCGWQMLTSVCSVQVQKAVFSVCQLDITYLFMHTGTKVLLDGYR